MNAADIKRQILINSDKTGMRKKLESGEAGLTSEDIIEMGEAFESMTKHKGWAYVESYILKNANPVGLLFTDVAASDNLVLRGKAQALILLMQWIQETIIAKNSILTRINNEREKQKTERSAGV
jgi:phytoene/squalene synthetase